MVESPRRAPIVLTATMVLLMCFLILQALGYGIGFFVDPVSGLGEFASPPPPGSDDLTVALVGLVGVGMIGAAALMALSVVLVLRGRPVGSTIGMLVGCIYLLAGVSVMRAGWTWDASFYLGGGGSLLLLCAASRWFQRVQVEE